MIAREIHLAGLCPCGCGQERDLSWHPDNDGWFEVEYVICHAGAAIEAARRRDDLPDGAVLSVTSLRDYTRDPLPETPWSEWMQTTSGGPSGLAPAHVPEDHSLS